MSSYINTNINKKYPKNYLHSLDVELKTFADDAGDDVDNPVIWIGAGGP